MGGDVASHGIDAPGWNAERPNLPADGAEPTLLVDGSANAWGRAAIAGSGRGGSGGPAGRENFSRAGHNLAVFGN